MPPFRQRSPLLGLAPEPTRAALRITDIFVVKGRGVVVCGTVARGTFFEGQIIDVAGLNGHFSSGIRGLEAFRERLTQASAGHTIGILLRETPPFPLARGDWVIEQGSATWCTQLQLALDNPCDDETHTALTNSGWYTGIAQLDEQGCSVALCPCPRDLGRRMFQVTVADGIVAQVGDPVTLRHDNGLSLGGSVATLNPERSTDAANFRLGP